MTLQDLKENRNFIISQIKYQGVNDLSKVMNYLVIWVNNSNEVKNAKPTKKNLRAYTMDAVKFYLKKDYKPTDNEIETILEEGKRQQMSAL
jgi:hypothetical protein